MSRQYNRTYELKIISADGAVRVITGLKIDFEVTKSSLSFPNLARIDITNASDGTLVQAQALGTKISLDVGYGGNNESLFIGDIRNVFRKREGTEKILSIYAGDGQKDWQNTVFNQTFSANVAISDAIKEVINSFKDVTVGVLQGLPNVADKLRGQTLSGNSRDILDQFAQEYGFSWSIQNGEVVIVPNGSPLSGREAVVISAQTGMIGSPTITEIGVDVTTLLNTRLVPDAAFVVKSLTPEIAIGNLFFRNVSPTVGEGLYKIQETTFVGGNRSKEWFSKCKGIAI